MSLVIPKNNERSRRNCAKENKIWRKKEMMLHHFAVNGEPLLAHRETWTCQALRGGKGFQIWKNNADFTRSSPSWRYRRYPFSDGQSQKADVKILMCWRWQMDCCLKMERSWRGKVKENDLATQTRISVEILGRSFSEEPFLQSPPSPQLHLSSSSFFILNHEFLRCSKTFATLRASVQ